MLEYYLPVKMIHIIFVLISGSLFFVRGVLLLNNHSWAMYVPVRYLSYCIDTVLLASALMLVAMLPSGMFSNGWLSLKIFLLVVYIVLGSFALKRGRSHKSRVIYFVAAVIVFCYMISVARMHHPLGIFFMITN